MLRNGCVALALAFGCLATAAPATTAAMPGTTAAPTARGSAPADPWQRVGSGITGGVSGAALVLGSPAGRGQGELIVARDNKKSGEGRLARVRLRPGAAPLVTPLTWKGQLPDDLEAIDTVPGRRNHFIALASRGTVFYVVVSRDTATVRVGPVTLPGAQRSDNYESFALHQDAGGTTYAVWATRGDTDSPAVVRTAEFRLTDTALRFGNVADRVDFSVPFPHTDEVRHLSDLKVLPDGTLLAAAASDPNDDNGPFSSAVYEAGSLTLDTQRRPLLTVGSPGCLTPLRAFTRDDDRKIEAVLRLRGDEYVWGTDDENHGGFLRPDTGRIQGSSGCP
ncbi:hypothetical protein ACFVIM_30465 [Streptomyces sp. NPDC057638]|uniref:hypothetical protein n=1 Tax=Streptomyces sp. NPDC057638 TaxID=3346190 RepID=UPI0036BFE42E